MTLPVGLALRAVLVAKQVWHGIGFFESVPLENEGSITDALAHPVSNHDRMLRILRGRRDRQLVLRAV